MKLENQVCAREQAERLAHLLGEARYNTQYYFERRISLFPGENWGIYHKTAVESENTIPAFNVAELGQMLPDWVVSARIDFDGVTWGCGTESGDYGEEADTEAQARAKMLIHLLQSNRITSEDVNKRLTES